jgi:hypothetical protein
MFDVAVVERIKNDVGRGVQPPLNQADLERFWADMERACQDRDDSVNDVIFEAFYTEPFYPEA